MSEDVLVVGAGPAGLAICSALSQRGLNVACLAPEHPAPWPNNYGVWEDEIAHLSLDDCYDKVWGEPVAFTDESPRELDRTYVRLDNGRLRERFREICEANGVDWLEGFAERIDITAGGCKVRTEARETHESSVVVDATGHNPALVERPGDRKPGYQAAYGFVGEFTESPIGDHDMVLMDYRPDYDEAQDPLDEATFLYAMRLDEERVFIEETSLVARPPVTFDILEDRLARRLRARGVDCTMVHEVERCLIPMGLPLPDLEQRVIGFGGAASMVHPATGYQMARMLRSAEPLATTIADGLESDDMDLDELSRRAWSTLWPAEEVEARHFWNFGMESLISLEPAELRRFFDAFFDLKSDDWKAYMSGTLPPARIPRVMWRLFLKATNSLRFSLAKSAFRPEGMSIFRAMLRRGPRAPGS